VSPVSIELLYYVCGLESRFRSRNPKRATELAEEPLPVHNKSNIKLNTSICLSFMNITYKNSKADLRQIDNLIVSPDTSTVYCKICWLTWLEIDAANDRLPAISDGMSASNVATWTLVRTYKLRTANKTLLPLRTFVSRHFWHPLGSAEPSLRKTDVEYSYNRSYVQVICHRS